ncbi:hypothetical protein DEV91_101231 [Phyllobacterium brassicacearum]|nr:hypothetical protein DEV91_101231 [Phyllobacterium brassicacearum]
MSQLEEPISSNAPAGAVFVAFTFNPITIDFVAIGHNKRRVVALSLRRRSRLDQRPVSRDLCARIGL